MLNVFLRKKKIVLAKYLTNYMDRYACVITLF
jgi:hypothetical protein